MEARKKADAIKAVEKQLKDDKLAEAERSVSLPSYPSLCPLESVFTDSLLPLMAWFVSSAGRSKLTRRGRRGSRRRSDWRRWPPR